MQPEPPLIDRKELVSIMFSIHDISENVSHIRTLLEEDDGEAAPEDDA
jgi:hypothetical protein